MNAWSLRRSSIAAVTMWALTPDSSIRRMPSGAARAHTTMIGSGAPRSVRILHVCNSEPPVASIGSITITGRPASDSGSLFTYGFGANVSSSRLMPMKPTSASGSSSWAACTNPSPARRIGTTTGCTARRRAGAVVSGVSTVVSTVGRIRGGGDEQQAADALEVLAEQCVRGRGVTDARQRIGDDGVLDECDGDCHGCEAYQMPASERQRAGVGSQPAPSDCSAASNA